MTLLAIDAATAPERLVNIMENDALRKISYVAPSRRIQVTPTFLKVFIWTKEFSMSAL